MNWLQHKSTFLDHARMKEVSVSIGVEEIASDEKSTEIQTITESAEIATACLITTTVSVSMILLNKAIVLNVPFSGGLVLLQNAATVLIVQLYAGCRGPKNLGWKTICINLPCAILFGANTFTSMQALSFLSVTAFTIFRNTQSIMSYPVDYFLRGERLKPISIFLLFAILLGTCAFCGKNLRANIEGVAWASAHVVSSTLYAVLIKMRIETEDADKENKVTKTLEMVWFNNLLSLPIVGIAATVQAVLMTNAPLVKQACGVACYTMVALSCFGGCAMSVVGLKTQALLSPVTFLLFNNLNKIPAMLISTAIWPHLETADSIQEIMGIILSLLGGFLFALSKQSDVHPVAIFVVVAISTAIVPLMVLGELADERLYQQLLNSTRL